MGILTTVYLIGVLITFIVTFLFITFDKSDISGGIVDAAFISPFCALFWPIVLCLVIIGFFDTSPAHDW